MSTEQQTIPSTRKPQPRSGTGRPVRGCSWS
jgi:hypothetical protein